jgi:phosphoribosylanthranilate isomerase
MRAGREAGVEATNLAEGRAAGPQVKICGLTRPEEALACARLGAAAIGLVFYPPSPRCVTVEQALAIRRRLPQTVVPVGVFVNPTLAEVQAVAAGAGLRAVQLHGQEPPALVAALRRSGLTVIKALFAGGRPAVDDAPAYEASAFLVECAGGRLPGGNARQWPWEEAAPAARWGPLVVAGGLAPHNVAQAAWASGADAVDVSSGVESAPGRKDPDRVADFMAQAARIRPARPLRPVFQPA